MTIKLSVTRGPVLIGHRFALDGEVVAVTAAQAAGLLARFPDRLSRVENALTPEPVTVPDGVVTQTALRPVADLGLSARVLDALDANDIGDVEKLRLLLEAGDEALLSMPGIGQRALEEIQAALEADAA